MSIPPEDIEEGEIIPQDETEDLEMSTDDELMEIEDDDEEEEVDLVSLMTSLLATENGDTICTALVSIGQQIQTQNKILIKILSEIKN